MKTTAKIVVGFAVTASVGLAGTTVYAQPARPMPTGTSQQTAQTVQQQEATPRTMAVADQQQRKQLSAEEQKELKARLDKRKAELKTKVSAADQQKLKTKCKNSQAVMGNVSNRIKTIETSRTEVYGGLISRLSIMSNRLQNQGMDKQLLQTHIDALQGMIATYSTDLTTYKQALSDLQDMDCASDPTAFKASLDTARSAQTKLKTDVTAIRAYVNDNVKPTLQQVRTQL